MPDKVWTKVYRRITLSSTWKGLTAPQKAVWFFVLSQTNSEEKTFHCHYCHTTYKTPVGSFTDSQSYTAALCDVNRRTVALTFKKLVDLEYWTPSDSPKCHRFYVVNKYEEHQEDRTKYTGERTGQYTGECTAQRTAQYTQDKEGEGEVEVEIPSDLKQVANALRRSILSWKEDYKNLHDPTVWKGVEIRWAKELRLISARDKRSTGRQLAVLKWLGAGGDNRARSWQPNILSPQKFRKHFDRLEMEMAKGSTRAKATYGRTEELITDESDPQWEKEIL